VWVWHRVMCVCGLCAGAQEITFTNSGADVDVVGYLQPLLDPMDEQLAMLGEPDIDIGCVSATR